LANYRAVGTGLRILGLILIVLVLFFGGILWFDYLGLIDGRRIVAPVLSWVGLRRRVRVEDAEDPLLLDRERLGKQREALDLISEDLSRREDGIFQKEAEIEQILDQLDEREEALEEREKSFNERINAFENRRVNLEQNSRYLTNMPPQDAVQILLNYENDMEVIDIIKITDELAATAGEASISPEWLRRMPAERAAELTRKMASRLPE
jgi:flagellar protein FlbB